MACDCILAGRNGTSCILTSIGESLLDKNDRDSDTYTSICNSDDISER